MNPVEITEGASPVILCQPHSGTFIPDEILQRLNARGRALADTDWHVDRLYAGLLPNATIIAARFHRYVIDANRPPSGASLYPGQNTTGLCPSTDFDGAPIYEEGEETVGVVVSAGPEAEPAVAARVGLCPRCSGRQHERLDGAEEPVGGTGPCPKCRGALSFTAVGTVG